MSDINVYIVVPTRNRHDTLGYAIQTCLQQDYANLEIIVSDNCSTAETAATVAKFTDTRIKYQRSERALSMRDSWEFALSAVKGDGLVHIMGDDNGLLPGAVPRIVDIACDTNTRAIHGEAVQYLWPDIEGHKCRIEIPIPRHGVRVNSQLNVGWNRLPNINMAFIHTSIVEEVRSFSGGRYFAAAVPDVYSAVTNAMCLDTYIYLNRAFAINGASRHSNGMASSIDGKMTFTTDTLAGGYRFHRNFPVNQSYHMGTYEAFAVAADNAAASLGKRVTLNPAKVLRKAIRNEYVLFHRTWIGAELLQFATLNGLKAKLPRLADAPSSPSETGPRKLIENLGDRVAFDSDLVTIPNVLEASRFAAKIIDTPHLLPPELLKRPLRSKLRAALLQYVLMGGTDVSS